ncbi:MAG: hypothetical protein GF364_03135 [Candidatus Lokiarchaeota archaeon]|nr:hypothetical protein [Candidatus Lokiarchaeota archaeon]
MNTRDIISLGLKYPKAVESLPPLYQSAFISLSGSWNTDAKNAAPKEETQRGGPKSSKLQKEGE